MNLLDGFGDPSFLQVCSIKGRSARSLRLTMTGGNHE